MSDDSGSATSLMADMAGNPQDAAPINPAPAPAETSAEQPVAQPETAPTPDVKTTPTEGRFFVSDEDLRNNPSLKKFMDDDGAIDAQVLAKSYVHADQMIGKDKMVIPTPESDDEQWAETYSRLGRPDEPTEYEIKRAELPDGIDAQYSEDQEASFRQHVHAAGLNNRQAQQLYDAMIQHRLEELSAWNKSQQTQREDAERTLRREQGANYDAFQAEARRGFQAYADADLIAAAEESGLSNDPRFMRVFAKIGKELAGETRLEGEPANAPTPADLDREINDFLTKFGGVLGDSSHPDYMTRKRAYDDLMRRRFPSEAA